MRQLALLFNQNYCIGCQACETACKTHNQLPIGVRWRVVRRFETIRGDQEIDLYLSQSCMHCEHPQCIAVCPVEAFHKRAEDGIVTQDRKRCIGCRACITACPHHALSQNRLDGRVSKCDFCVDLIQQQQVPACVRGCPVQALRLGTIEVLEQYGAEKYAFGFKTSEYGPSIRFVPKRK